MGKRAIKRKPPKSITVEFCDGPIAVRQLSAAQLSGIEARFPIEGESKVRPAAYFAEIMANAVTDEAGSMLWDGNELQTLDAGDFWSLWSVVGKELGLVKEDKVKNSPARTSPESSQSPSESATPSA